jgi:hypothetical protein
LAEVGRIRRHERSFEFEHGIPPIGRYPPDALTIAEAIEAIRNAPVEIGYGFDAAGRQGFPQVGDQDAIRWFDSRDLRAIAGGTFVHIHPPYAEFSAGDPCRRAGSFSASDLAFMYEVRLTEMIAVTKEHPYRLRQLLGGFFLDPGQIYDEYEVQRVRVIEELRQDAARGTISVEAAAAAGRIADEVMKRLRLYFDYRWSEVTEDAS